MSSAKRYMVIALTFATIMTVFAAFTPRVAHAVAAALVQVANTMSTPVPTRATDNPGLHPFGTRVYPSPRLSATIVVPEGKMLVIDHVAAFAIGSSATPQDVELYSRAGGAGTALRIPFTSTVGGIKYAAQQITMYADPASAVFVYIHDTNIDDPSGFNVDIQGHYVDCTNGGGC